tara:strand:- start:13523 stop:16039 length:2517 start_codon:yes stop_codon:yes gene_type:complete
MALIFKDRVKETTTTTGQGTVTLLGNVDGFRSFADIGDANTTYYCIFDNSANTFEIGIGTYTASGTTLSRDTVLQTSSGNTTKINFASGNKEVFCVYPAGKAVYLDENGDLTINGVKHLNAISNRWTKTATSNQTVFTGNSDDSTTLSVGEHTQVFLNGIMLKKTTDYALSNNDTITLTSGASANDILESITFAPFTVASALQPSNNLSDVSSASTALSNLGGMSSSGGTFSGNVSLGSNDLSTTGKILFANMYATEGDLPSASQQHGMLAHVHNYNSTGVGRAVFAHGGNWIPLANHSELSSYLLSSAVSSYGATLIDDADAPTARTTLGLGTMAVETASNYLTTSSASSTYLTQSNASSTYLTQSSASSTYLTQSNASSTYAPLSGATFTGNIVLPQTGVLAFNSTSDEYITASASNLYFGVDNGWVMQLDGANNVVNINSGHNLELYDGSLYVHDDIFIRGGSSSYTTTYNSSGYGTPLTLQNSGGYVGMTFEATGSYANTWQIYASGTGSNKFTGMYDRNGGYYVNQFYKDGRVDLGNGRLSITTGGSATASGDFRAPRFYDSGNTSYYVDPASTSHLDIVYAKNHTSTPIVYDWNNSSYYCDPSSTSSLYNVTVNNQLYLNTNTTLSSAGTVGTAGQVLTSNGNSRPTWQDAGGGGTWTEVNTVTLSGNGSSTFQNWSITANKHYRFTFYDFYFAGYDDRISARISCDGGSSFVNLYGTSAFRNGWSTMSWSTSNATNSSYLQLQGSSNIKGNDARYKGAYCEVHFYAPTNGGGNLYSRTWWPRALQEMAYAEARCTTSSFQQTANYLRLQPHNYGFNSSQGFRGYLKVETLG